MTRAIFFILGIICISSCTLMDKSPHPQIDKIFLTWELKGNDAEKEVSQALFVLENRGGQELGNSGWELYFSQMGEGVNQESVTGNVRIDHINGDLLRISPLEDFMLAPGQVVEISYDKPGSLIKETEAPAGPYFVFENSAGNKQEAHAVVNYTIRPYPGLEKIFPSGTGIPLPDAKWVFEQNTHLEKLDSPQVGRIIPTPVHEESYGETTVIESGVKIHYQAGLETEFERLAEHLENFLGAEPLSEISESTERNIILLTTETGMEALSEEGYMLSVTAEDGITIRGGSASGVFYGIQSLLALLPVETWNSPQERVEIECGSVNDSPAFEYRGMVLDIARNFNGPQAIKKLIDAMAFYKMNRFQLHLADDEAWRIEISSLPELTEVGGFRGHTQDSKDHLFPVYGSGPYPDTGIGSGSGFLSREEFIDILKYARARHIEVIPEVNFPGHARAAIHAMEARYDRLMAEGKAEEAERFRLIDPEDQSRYNSAQNYDDNVVCVCKEAPYLFFETVVDEIVKMYRDAGLKLKVIHVGGDEVPQGSWTGSPLCEAFLKEHPEVGGAADLQVYFEGRLLEIISRKNMIMAEWEEIALKKNERGVWIPNQDFVGKGMLPYVWNSLDEFLDLGNRVANADFPVVLCNVNNFYFDLAYTHHPAEPGHYWGGFVTTRRAFEFIPFNVFHSTLTNKYRQPYGPEMNFEGMDALRTEARKNIIGLQGELWSETVKGGQMLEYYYLPKMLGLAERAWAGQAEWGEIPETDARVKAIDASWNRFANVIGQREMPRLDHIFGGYNYRLPPPGAVIRDGMVHANIDFPGLIIRYTTDGTDPDPESPVYTGPVEAAGTIKLASFDTRGRSSRISIPE